jgi:hypothetical protein
LLPARAEAGDGRIPNDFAGAKRPYFPQADPLPLSRHLPRPRSDCRLVASNQLATTNEQILANKGKGQQSKSALWLMIQRSRLVAANRSK